MDTYNFQMELVIEIEELKKEVKRLKEELKIYEDNNVQQMIDNDEFIVKVKKIFRGL